MTTEMNEALRSELVRNGWDPEKVLSWGRRVSGSPGHLRLEREGQEKSYFSPFVAIQVAGQAAIVRFG